MREKPPLIRQTAVPASERETFADDVRYYMSLQPRQLPSRYFYDAVGSALFETICRLPWYAVTRSEMKLLASSARDIFCRLGSLGTVIELGPGSGEKLARLIELGRRRSTPLTLHLVDVSPTALAAAANLLSSLSGTTIVTHEAPYEVGLAQIASERRITDRAMVLFLGSNIGNFDPPGAAAFLGSVRSSLARGDALLIGTDLVKNERDLMLAYDDPLGVTAAFNRNLLLRINRELDGDFDLERFTHRAVWNGAHSRVEMHLVSTCRQDVAVRAAGLAFTMAEGESIWTESSYKYQPAGVRSMLEREGFVVLQQWVDSECGFAVTLSTRT
jgi:L-histidine N-alpha-methyltransferase